MRNSAFPRGLVGKEFRNITFEMKNSSNSSCAALRTSSQNGNDLSKIEQSMIAGFIQVSLSKIQGLFKDF